MAVCKESVWGKITIIKIFKRTDEKFRCPYWRGHPQLSSIHLKKTFHEPRLQVLCFSITEGSPLFNIFVNPIRLNSLAGCRARNNKIIQIPIIEQRLLFRESLWAWLLFNYVIGKNLNSCKAKFHRNSNFWVKSIWRLIK